jgi:hypothetical protein
MHAIRFGKLELLPAMYPATKENSSDILVIPRHTLAPSQHLARLARVDGLHQQVAIQLNAMDALILSKKEGSEGDMTQLISYGTSPKLDTWEKRHEAATRIWDLGNHIRQLVIKALVQHPNDPDPTPNHVEPDLGQARYLMRNYNYLLHGSSDSLSEQSIHGKLQKLGVPQEPLEQIRQTSFKLSQTLEELFA